MTHGQNFLYVLADQLVSFHYLIYTKCRICSLEQATVILDKYVKNPILKYAKYFAPAS